MPWRDPKPVRGSGGVHITLEHRNQLKHFTTNLDFTMPILTLNSSKALPESLMTKIAASLADITESILHKNRKVIVVRFETGDQQATWYSEGRVPADALIFDLNIVITKGTNTESEKSDWINAAWRVVTEAAGASSYPNYIAVRELDGADWGYNGVTQSGRKKAAA